MRYIACLAMGLVLLVIGPVRADDKPVLVRDLKENVRAVLVGARHSKTRGRYLIVRLKTVEKEPKVIHVAFPAHSFTTHEQTLRAAVLACVDLTNRDADGWSPAEAEAIFSVPRDDAKGPPGRYSRLERCCLLSLRLRSKQ
jgi:hypothetical protein